MSDRENNGEDELSLPKTTVHKLITEMLPSDIACSKETREILIECCVEFIHLLASEANDVCEKESKKTIAAEHVISALQSLGFDEYIPHIQAVFHDHKNTMKIRDRKSSRLENSGLTEEELLKSQEELFAKARQRYQTQSSSTAPGLESPPLTSNASFTPFSFPPPPS
ncbi:negative cofactor 2 transcription regulator complex subunit ncb2 [Entomophthora muscae]|uniref:Negative cofactor 2 transcription regulator complex subunit ncb2 n=1 Tax=Entomophthora muscae TaxID=34485 RepID=A0ACC2RHQ1_9FUNG|nr:negative cofactor 2 transcription regulator complex subunit ncb2 [Entomophthora muscae]